MNSYPESGGVKGGDHELLCTWTCPYALVGSFGRDISRNTMSKVLDASPIPSGRLAESKARARPLKAAHGKGRQNECLWLNDGSDRVADLNDHNEDSARWV